MTALAIPEPAEPLTLSALIRTVLTDTDLVTPDEVADEVAARTPDECLRDFYRAALRERVRAAMQISAAAAMHASDDDDETSPTGHRTSVTHDGIAGRGAKQKPVRSGKFAAINAKHLERLRQIIQVGDVRKRFGDLTRDDLLTAADARDVMASRNAAMAAKFRRVEKEMANRGTATVRDLPPDVLDTALKG
ncbi:hypothetical protein SCMU_14620 [Sinomonas cyclohexanicum]|uniref:Uncharacterized protein n=1 Tax=Sinomonas cyclohexanicum TaxID=322009 RepID=A0ABM7PTP0_SINCY|nr:hypothetical protein [Corynebacterium cyclohexanicum]BCT75620.1 hypothetical protein SCMU_14620 [Corynebacterium cyclohexanicum]